MSIFLTLFCGVFIAVGLGMSGFGVRTVLRDRASTAWPLATGRITESKTVEKSDSDGTTYAPEIHYVYTVAKREFDGQRISYGMQGMSSGGRFANLYLQKYPVGKEVRVAYQPGHPENSVLERGLTKRSFVMVVFGLGFAGAGAWFLLLFWLFDGGSGRVA